jgi:hydrogenase-4 component B
MDIYSVLLFSLGLTLLFGIFILQPRFKQIFVLLPAGLIAAISSYAAVLALISGNAISYGFDYSIPDLIIDRISAFFILVINFTVLTGFVYAHGYMKSDLVNRKPVMISLHYFSLVVLHISMLLVCMIRDGMAFLIVWELMTVSSFLLVVFEADERSILKTGVSYLVQMHVGFLFLLTAFLVAWQTTGQFGFDALPEYFHKFGNISLFLLFFAGFGIKAGFIPLHTWLPQAHPAAPSHVSGMMSGVMIKLGIYGIFRILGFVQYDLLTIGVFVLGISLMSSLYGVMQAIVQHDLKRLLAYHSIENIGIIGIGMGLGTIGLATDNSMLALLGFTGSLLHVLNHSLFKSLLFYATGAVYHATHTRNIEELGGLAKKMPYTAGLFLLGSLSICGLPPFNGFISEYLIYLGMIKSLHTSGLYESVTLMLSLVGLTLTGGLAIFCFTKAFGIVFLGEARSSKCKSAQDPEPVMLIPQLAIAVLIILIGILPAFFVKPVADVACSLFDLRDTALGVEFYSNLGNISLAGGIFILVALLLLGIRQMRLKKVQLESGPTWGCGYTVASAKMQYTATSFADNYSSLAGPLLGMKKHFKPINEGEIFPETRSFETHSSDHIKTSVVDGPVNRLMRMLRKLAFLQTGQIQHYILYPFIFILVVLLLTMLNLI